MYEKKNAIKYLLISLLLIIVDQGTKMLVHFNMEPGFPGQIVLLGDWLKLHYVLNPGMAFGMQLGHEYGKLFLTLFRLVAMFVIGWYLVHLALRKASQTLLLALSLILAGAVGNVIDSIFYGAWLGNAPVGSSTPWFHGQVIDMIFVDFWEGFLPDWIPVFGGQYYSTPIFNVADSCIFIGVCIVLIFQGHFYTPPQHEDSAEDQHIDSTEEEEFSGVNKENDEYDVDLSEEQKYSAIRDTEISPETDTTTPGKETSAKDQDSNETAGAPTENSMKNEKDSSEEKDAAGLSS